MEADDESRKENLHNAVRLAKQILDDDFALSLMHVGKCGDRETFDRVVAASKKLSDLLKPSSNLLNAEQKQAATSVTQLALTLDPLRGSPGQGSNSAADLNYVQTLQPVLSFEVLQRSTADAKELAQRLCALAGVHKIGFPDLVHQVIRCSLMSLGRHKATLDVLKWDAFLLGKLPRLLEGLAAVTGVERMQLRAPTETYKAFDKLLKNENLLNRIDVFCQCNIIEVLLQVKRIMFSYLGICL